MTMEGIPQYSQSPYYPYAPPAPAQPVEEAPAKQPGHPRLYALVGGVLFVVLIMGALALAAYSPSLAATQSGAIPQGWAKVYDANLAIGDNSWDGSAAGCSYGMSGFDASGVSSTLGSYCAFLPSESRDLLTNGFLLEMTVAPAANVSSNQVAMILIGDNTTSEVFISVDQQGNYLICDISCDPTVTSYARGATAAWHTDPYVANSFGVLFAPSNGGGSVSLTLFANGEQVATANIGASLTLTPGTPTPFGIGSSPGSQAIFTHATLYSGTANNQ